MVKLRNYQSSLAGAIKNAFTRVMAVLAVLTTGGGKTVIFSTLINEHIAAKKGGAAAVVHRKEILSQISCSLAALDVKHRVVAPPAVVALIRRKHLKRFNKSFIDPHAPCGVLSVQTLTSKSSANNQELQRFLKQVTFTVYDEGHHYVKQGLWGRAVEMMSAAKLLFVTATPERADGKGLGAHADGYAEEMVEGPDARWLIKNGYLSSFIYKAPSSDINLDDIPVTASGEVNAKVLRQRTVESHLVGDVVQQYLDYAPGKKAIVFASDVATAEEIAAAFKARGVKAEALSGATDDRVRDKALEDFEFSDLQVLVNVDLFDEGFDVPAADCAILARVTMSLAKFLQMVGRVLRPVYAEGHDLSTAEGRLAAIAAGPKPHAIIIDPVRNWERHGMPNWPRAWTLDGREKGTRGTRSDVLPQRICTACTQPYEVVYKACPYCGAPMPEPAGRATPEQVDGDLFDLDVEAMAELFDKMRRADMTAEEFGAELYKQNADGKIVPPAYHGKLIRKHNEALYRRGVLRNLVAWWVGVQPEGRELPEVHRRFYHRFGTDIGTAFTLNAADTDKLIEKITAKFTEDLTT